jgi:S-DNA-T family DNA segregation ATPase FtsK/SpoIIIE
VATTKNKILDIDKSKIEEYKTKAIDVDYFEIEPFGTNEIPIKCEYKSNKNDLINTLKCFVGAREYGKQQCIDFYEDGSLLIGGASRQGKTSLIYSILLSLMDRYEPSYLKIILVDFKQVDLVRIDKYKHVMNDCITDIDRFKNMLGQMEIECDKRVKYFRELDVANIQEFNKISEKKIRPILIVIDEIAQILVGSAKEVEPLKERLHKLICKSMAFGLYWCVCTQELSRDTLGKMKINFTQTVGLKCKDKTASDLIIKNSELENINVKGRAKIDNSEGVVEFQPYLVTLTDFKGYLNHLEK